MEKYDPFISEPYLDGNQGCQTCQIKKIQIILLHFPEI